MKINELWHKKHPMPSHPTQEQRAQWHIAHAKYCGCRDIPESVQKYLLKKRIEKKTE